MSLHALLGLLPEHRSVLPLREALLTASAPDPARRWEHSRSYGTLDLRILDAAAVRAAADRVARDETARVARTLELLAEALAARAAGHRDEVAATLLELGTFLLGERHYGEALDFLGVALVEARATGAHTAEATALLRMGRASLRLGRLEEAAEAYALVRQRFRDESLAADEVAALQGLGNVRVAQGRWREAERDYLVALDVCPEAEALLRGQIFNNLCLATRHQGRLDEAGQWQDRAEAVWAEVEAREDRVVAWNNRGLLEVARGALDPAREALLQGLELSSHELQKAAFLTNLAQVEVRAGALDRAEELAREAESYAILAGATEFLIEIYTVLGVVFRERGDDQGFVFFEKAVELAADDRYPLPRARAHQEYGRLRRATDPVEARAHFDQARAIYERLGAGREADEARAEAEAVE